MKTVTLRAMGIVLALGIGPAAAQEHRSSFPADEDLIRWIGDACPSTPDLMALMRLDQVAGKAVTDWLRTGRYRDAQRLAARYLDCLKGLGLSGPGERDEAEGPPGEGPAAPRIAMLEQVLCFLPLVIFEVEQRVDADMAAQSLARCPRPPADPPGDRKVWGEAVRRYLHLVAAVRAPAEVLDAALSSLEALRKAGFPFPDRFAGPPRPPGRTSTEGQDEPAPPTTPDATWPGDEVTGEGASGEGAGLAKPEGDDDPDPVFAAMVLGIGAAVAAGDLDGLLRVVSAGKEADRGDRGPTRSGDRVPTGAGKGLDREAQIEAGDTADDDPCSSAFLAALGVMQVMVGSPHAPGHPVSRRAALPLLQTALVSRAPFDARMRTVHATLDRFGGPGAGWWDKPVEGRPGPERPVPPAPERLAPPAGRKPCVVPQVVASLVLASLDGETLDRAVAEGRATDLALLVSATSLPVGLPGSADSRFQVLRLVAERASGDEDRGRWLCALGDAALAAGRIADAVAAFGSAVSLREGPGRACGARGRLRALIADPTADPDRIAAAARAFLETGPDASDVYGILAEAPDPRGRAAAIRALCDAGRVSRGEPVEGPGLVEAVLEALIKVVDSDPGSEAARLALDAVGRAGGPARREDRVIWGLVSGRHHVVSRQEREANRVLKEAFSLAGPDMQGAREGTAALLRWLAANDHVRVLDRAVALARAARLVETSVLAEVGAIRGERGDRGRAKALLRQAILARPSGTGDWLTIADAYARMDEPTLASAALDKAGPETSWDRRHHMVRGRIEMDRRRYREAAAAYTRASDLSRGDCEPLFFRGLVRLLLGDAEGAAQDFERCMMLGNDSPQVLGGLAYAHFDLSAWDRAERTFRDALAKDEKTADNHVGLAMTLFRQGRVAEARRSFERAVELEPAMGKGYAEAEKKGYVYTAIEKKAWTEMVRAFRALRGSTR